MKRYFLPLLIVAAVAVTGTIQGVPGSATASRAKPGGSFQGHTADWWAARAVANRRRINQLNTALRADPQVVEAINSACVTYGNCTTLWRRARCESRLDPKARNKSGATGLFQFLPSTWATTPYARMDITSPYASALAAGWMIRAGRGNEWTCR